MITAGLVFWTIGVQQTERILTSDLNADERQKAQDNADHNSLGGASLVMAGACVLGIAAVMWQTAPPAQRLSISPIPGGGILSLGGSIP